MNARGQCSFSPSAFHKTLVHWMFTFVESLLGCQINLRSSGVLSKFLSWRHRYPSHASFLSLQGRARVCSFSNLFGHPALSCLWGRLGDLAFYSSLSKPSPAQGLPGSLLKYSFWKAVSASEGLRGAWDSAHLSCSQVVLMLLACRPRFEQWCLRKISEGCLLRSLPQGSCDTPVTVQMSAAMLVSCEKWIGHWAGVDAWEGREFCPFCLQQCIQSLELCLGHRDGQ